MHNENWPFVLIKKVLALSRNRNTTDWELIGDIMENGAEDVFLMRSKQKIGKIFIINILRYAFVSLFYELTQ